MDMGNDFNKDNDIVAPATWIPENSIIKVIGVGGGGCNAVNYMYNQKIEGCTFIVANTDPQSLDTSPVPVKIRMGELGAGTDPIKGRNAATEAADEIRAKVLENDTKMLFITAGMGGGTGTGAAPVIAKMSKEMGILTVGVVTLPFKNERNGSLTKAMDGIQNMKKYVDSLLIIDNQKIFEIYGDLLIYEAFPKTDEVLATAVKTILDTISQPGYINVDFRDIKKMMGGSGLALMGSGEGRGENRIADAVKNAMVSPLLMAFDPSTAKNALVNVTVGYNEQTIRSKELDLIDEELNKYLGKANRFKRGIVYSKDENWGDKISITVIATGIRMSLLEDLYPMDDSNFIHITGDFVYNGERTNDFRTRDEAQVERISAASNNKGRCFHFTEENKPLLCIEKDGDRSVAEGQAAYYRIYPNDEDNKI